MLQDTAVAPLMLIAPLLIVAAYRDMRFLRIPNAIIHAALAVFIIAGSIAPPPDLTPRIVVAAVVLLLGMAGSRAGVFGRGDFRMLAVVMLFVPAPSLRLFCFVFAAALFVGYAGVVSLRTVVPSRARSWQVLREDRRFPLGLSIALAGLVHPLLVIAF